MPTVGTQADKEMADKEPSPARDRSEPRSRGAAKPLRRGANDAARVKIEEVEHEEQELVAAAYARKSGLEKVFEHVHADERCPHMYGLFLLEVALREATAPSSPSRRAHPKPTSSRPPTQQQEQQEDSPPRRIFKYEPKRNHSSESGRQSRMGRRSHTPTVARAPLTVVNDARRPYHHYEYLDLLTEAAAETRLMPAPVLPFSPCPSPFGRETLMAKKRRQQTLSHEGAASGLHHKTASAAHLRTIAARIEARFSSDGSALSVGETTRALEVLRQQREAERWEQRAEAYPSRRSKLPPIASGRAKHRLEAVNTYLSTRANSPSPGLARK